MPPVPVRGDSGTMSTTDDERALALRFRTGDADAVREVYRRYTGRLHTLCRSMLGDPALVDDAVQQTFLQAWRAASRFDVNRPLSAWLYAIARRVCIDEYRKASRAPAVARDDEAIDGVVDGPSLDRTWTVWEVRRAIDELPADERLVVRMASLEGWSLSDIADHLGLPIGTVKSRSFRAHRRLAAALAHLRHDEPELAAV
jgi:RNA polymerase sigma-70 factor, ECF subfamily